MADWRHIDMGTAGWDWIAPGRTMGTTTYWAGHMANFTSATMHTSATETSGHSARYGLTKVWDGWKSKATGIANLWALFDRNQTFFKVHAKKMPVLIWCFLCPNASFWIQIGYLTSGNCVCVCCPPCLRDEGVPNMFNPFELQSWESRHLWTTHVSCFS